MPDVALESCTMQAYADNDNDQPWTHQANAIAELFASISALLHACDIDVFSSVTAVAVSLARR